MSILLPHVAEGLLAQRTLISMLGKLPETVSVHCVPTLQVNGGLLTSEQVILLTDGTRPVQCLLRVFMCLKVALDYACIALITVREVIFAALSADATPVTVVVLFMSPVCIVNYTLAFLARASSTY